MIKTSTSFNSDVVYRTHDLIASAIREDFSNTDLTIGNYESYVFEKDDPLGMAFYQFAILETGYRSQELSANPETWNLWLENRLDNEIPTPYIDTELSAMGLVFYALSRKEIKPINSYKFIKLADENFSNESGIHNNFLATVLVGLGISKLENNGEVFSKFNRYIDTKVNDHRKSLFNDSKNLVVTYLWSKEAKNSKLREDIRLEVFNRYSTKSYLNRDIVYLAYILIEEIKSFSRSKRVEIKSFIEESLKFVVDYTLEGRYLSNDVKKEYGDDIAFGDSQQWEIYGYPSKPPLSRIILSLGFLIRHRYVSSPNIFNSWEQILNKSTSVFAFFLIFAGLGLGSLYLWGTLEIINDFKVDFATQEFIRIVLGLVKAAFSSVLLTIGITLLITAVLLSYNIIKDVEINITRSITKTKEKILPLIRVELALAILVNILTSLR